MKKKTPQQPALWPPWEQRNTPGSLQRLLERSDGGGLHPAVGLFGVEVFPGLRISETMAEINIVGDHHASPHDTCGEDHKGFPILGRDV